MSLAEPFVGIVDYGMGNRRSVEKAFYHVGARARLTGDLGTLRQAAALLVPGVGAFPTGMQRLRAHGLDELIQSGAAGGTPILGICLGMQLLFEASEELEPTSGLGLLPGRVTALATGGLRVPHIGWNDVRLERACPLMQAPAAFYHVHSFAARPEDPEDIVATADYGERFATVVARGNVYGVQFHPEKSSLDGLALLAAFADLAGARNGAGKPDAAAA
jgi:glutamine amidotransferase